MASAEQPLKKRKLYDSFPEPSILPNQSFVPAPPPPLPPLSQDEILRKRRNREEIRSLYECYRRIRFCISQKDERLMPDFEQAYLSLITASRGCTSVQRIVAELIPRYASYCPTALEAAAKVAINMYNWSLAIVMRGEDVDGVAYQTAKACIFGLVDICCTASYEAPTSSVIQGICSAVFLNVLTFFTSTFEGKDIYQIGLKGIAKLQEPMESFCGLKQELACDNEPALYKLFKLRALSLLRIFFSCPKNLLAACFELFVSSGSEVSLHKRGQYFLTQVISQLKSDEATDSLDKTNDEASLCTNSTQTSIDFKGTSGTKPVSNANNVSEVSKNCFMGMAIDRDPSLRSWILSRYKKLSESLSSEAISEISSSLEEFFGSLSDLVEEADCDESEEDKFDPSKYTSRQYLVQKISKPHDSSVDVSGRDCSSRVPDATASDAPHEKNDAAEQVVGQTVMPRQLVLPCKADISSVNEGFTHESDGSVSTKNLETEDLEDSRPENTSMLKDSRSNWFLSYVNRKQSDLKNDDTDASSHGIKVEKNQASNIDHLGLLQINSASGGASTILPSPEQHSATEYHVTSKQIIWYSDGDPAAMDVFSASKQLWLGSLGHDASETLVRLQFEDFGPLEHFLFFPTKDFALIEYRNLMDAVRARECMQGSSPWGASLRVRFLDIGLGSRGAVYGVAVGDSCHVYIGKVSTQWAKDEILHDLMTMGLRNPHMVTDFASEKALLLEYGSAEEAAAAMAHIRQQRMSNKSLTPSEFAKDTFPFGCQLLVRQIDNSVSDEELINAFSRFGELIGWRFIRQSGCCLIDFQSYEAAHLAKSNLDGARFGPMSIHVEVTTSNPGTVTSSLILSPPAPTLHDSSIDRTIISQLSNLFASICEKYKIGQGSSSYESQRSKNYYPTAMKDVDRARTNTLWIGLPDIHSPIFTDDELMALCNLAIGKVGSVVRLTRASMQNSCWFVEFSSVDAAVTALKNIQSCPGMFLRVEFRSSGTVSYHNEHQFTPGRPNASGYFPPHGDLCSSGLESKLGYHYPSPFTNKRERSIHELVSPSGQAFQSNWSVTRNTEMLEVGLRKFEDFGSSMGPHISFAEAPATSHVDEQIWKYKKHETEPQILVQGSLPCPSPVTLGGSVIPPPIQASSFVRPIYLTPTNSWENRALNPSLSLNQTSTGLMSNNNLHVNACATIPFIPSSITPLSQLSGSLMQRFEQMVTIPGLPSISPPPPPPSDMPPPLPLSQPPYVPPPPSSPPPLLQPVLEPSNSQTRDPCLHYQWQGTLSKSGVHYCELYAIREDSDACKYSNSVSEPADWPVRLDVRKRTDFRHVKSIFAGTPPDKREVCRLLPSTTSDHKGLHDFISYLKQRECAGVIKIPAGKSMWARLLFILPYSLDTCSLLSIAPGPAECLIALVLPKETNFDWV